MESFKFSNGETSIEPGSSYRIRHKRKGEFTATVLGVKPAKTGDPDFCFLLVSINTREGSPYAWMANVRTYIAGRKTTPLTTEKLLRPSLIESIERV